MEVAALVPAAGVGTRFAGTVETSPAAAEAGCAHPNTKQFLQLLDVPLYIWSVEKLCQCAQIETVSLILPEHAIEFVNSQLKSYLPKQERQKIELTVGGTSRQQSVYKGLLSLSARKPRLVLVHDAVRPFLTAELIDASLQMAGQTGACTVATPITDTVKRAADGTIEETVDRSRLYSIQTPQAARYEWLLAAHQAAVEKGLETTDDAAILEAGGHKVSIVPGQTYNVKLTTSADLRLCQALAEWFKKSGLAPKVV